MEEDEKNTDRDNKPHREQPDMEECSLHHTACVMSLTHEEFLLYQSPTDKPAQHNTCQESTCRQHKLSGAQAAELVQTSDTTWTLTLQGTTVIKRAVNRKLVKAPTTYHLKELK